MFLGLNFYQEEFFSTGFRLYRGWIRQDVYMSDGVGLLGTWDRSRTVILDGLEYSEAATTPPPDRLAPALAARTPCRRWIRALSGFRR